MNGGTTTDGDAMVPTDTLRVRRRTLLSALALSTVAAGKDVPALPSGARLLVAGPQGGETDRWADALGRALAAVPLRREAVGGPDGVTGANRFEARTAPDGDTALVTPGTAATAWLVGDARAQFDAARWVPVLAGIGSGVLVSRVAARPGAILRMAVASVVGPDLPGLLGLDMLGTAVEPVPGPSGMEARDALLNGQVDAIFLRGAGAATAVQWLAMQGVPALFTIGSPDEAGQPVRDRNLPDLPVFPELLARRQPLGGQLYAAWRATAAAAALDVGVVLPREAPAGTIAQWRRACVQAAGSPELMAVAAAQDARPLAAASAATCMAAVAPDADALLELRRWLGQRHGWRPG